PGFRLVSALLESLNQASPASRLRPSLIVPEQVRSCSGATTAPRCVGSAAPAHCPLHKLRSAWLAKKGTQPLGSALVPCPLFKTQAHRPAPCLGMRDSILSNPLRPSPVKIYRSLCP